jgi:putative NIF3 family GTP cyclohydrolase 1 type 2
MSKPRRTHVLPTHAQLIDFISSFLPIHPSDIPFSYHTPHSRSYDITKGPVSHVVLSITPTPGVYEKVQNLANREFRPPVCFLHRPFGLDRRAVPRGTLILASHKRFDERLTVGYNIPLAGSLGLDIEDHVVLQGYRGDPDRLMGLVGQLRKHVEIRDVRSAIERQFKTCELYANGVEQMREVNAVAIVNAFNADMVQRVAEAAVKRKWANNSMQLGNVLYLTGQPRETGLESAEAVGMPVACVGHRAAEEWGIRWIADQLRAEYSGITVFEILEDEEDCTANECAR